MTDVTEKKTILLVDDDVDFLLQHRLMLEREGYDVLTAETRPDAETLLAERRVNLVIADLMMEHADDGFVLCHHIRQRSPEMPVILVTGVTRQTGLAFDTVTEDERSWIRSNRVLAKPVAFQQLLAEVRRLLGNTSQTEG
jgi:CheY-like chemotaxis protein